ncbi:MAG: GTPase HflX, partial [Actinomycetota bacterium]|nr:GTPase HflX [Actinomycetota bacterium]
TLDEVREADLLMHVIDGSHPQADAQANAVDVVLNEIDAHRKPRLLVVNKCDVMSPEDMNSLSRRHPDAVFISAFTGQGLEELLARIAKEASRGTRLMTVLIPYTRGELVQLAHERAQVVSERHTGEGTGLVLSVPSEFISRFEPYLSPAVEDSVEQGLLDV